MVFVLDTNILIHLIRQTPDVQAYLSKIGTFNGNNYMNISIVSVAELKTFAYRNNWGASKMTALNALVTALNPIAIDNQNIVDAYVEIDLFSQGKHPQHPLPKGTSARTMGKNDIWIAATTYFLDAQLVTTDSDFLHLDSVFFDVAHTVVV
jgi:tRNA(fMet)-specific endonuclease VapC